MLSRFKSYKTLLFLLPWLLQFPALLFLQIKKLDIPHTWKLSESDRKVFFLKKAMPWMKADYFDFLLKADPFLPRQKTMLAVRSEGLSGNEDMILSGYSYFWFSPARMPPPGKNPEYEIIYRTSPPLKGKILLTVDGDKPSYLVDLR